VGITAADLALSQSERALYRPQAKATQ